MKDFEKELLATLKSINENLVEISKWYKQQNINAEKKDEPRRLW